MAGRRPKTRRRKKTWHATKKGAKTSGKLGQVLKELKLSYDEAQLVLIVAEHCAFPDGMALDPIVDVDILDRLDRPVREPDLNIELAKLLARSTDARTRAAVKRVLDANSD